MKWYVQDKKKEGKGAEASRNEATEDEGQVLWHRLTCNIFQSCLFDCSLLDSIVMHVVPRQVSSTPVSAKWLAANCTDLGRYAAEELWCVVVQKKKGGDASEDQTDNTEDHQVAWRNMTSTLYSCLRGTLTDCIGCDTFFASASFCTNQGVLHMHTAPAMQFLVLISSALYVSIHTLNVLQQKAFFLATKPSVS